MPDDQLYAGITEILKKHGIGLPAAPTARPASEITAPPPKDDFLSGIQETLKKHGIGMGAGAGEPKPAGEAIIPPAPDFTKHLQDNRHLDFVDRALRPEKYPVIKNEDGSESTHLMGSADNIAFPHIVRKPGEDALTKLSPQEAREHARKTGEFIEFKSPEEADQFATGGYKTAAEQVRKATSAAPEGAYPLAPPSRPVPFAPASVSKEPLAIRAFKELGRFAAAANKPVMDTVHGFARGLELALDIPRKAIQGGETPHVLTAATGAVREAVSPQNLIDEAHPVTKFLGNLLGGLESYMLPTKTLGAAGVVLPNASLIQKFGSNLITFGATDVFQTVGVGGSDEQVRNALLKSIPTAALFTVAQAIPFDKLTKNPWLTKALEGTATGTAFAGSHALGGETDPAALAVSFLTGFALHTITSGIPRYQKGFSPEEMKKFWDDHFKDYTVDWKETNKVTEERWAAVKEILDAIKQEPVREAEPLIDQYGKPIGQEPVPTVVDKAGQAWRHGEPVVPGEETLPPEVQAALQKQPWLRNAQEKLLADQARKDAGVVGVTSGAPGEEWPARERANVGEEAVDRLQRAVDIVGDSNAGKKLGDLLAGNQEDLANAFRAPGEAPGIPEITDKIMDLAQKVEDTGDPGAAKELHDFINSNLGALKGLPRWPVASTEGPMGTSARKAMDITAPAPGPEEVRPAATEMVSKGLPSVNPAGRSNEVPDSLPKEAPPAPPRVTPAAPEPPSGAPAQAGGAGNVGLSPTPSEAPKKRGALVAPKPALPDQPMEQSGRSAMVATPEAPAEAGKVDPLQAAKDFKTKFGSRQGAPDVGIEGQPTKVWMPPSKRSRTYDFDRAAEHGDIDTMILSKGGFDSKSEIFKDLEPEERNALFRYMRSKDKFPTVKGPDVMFEDLKTEYPHLFPWETEADFLMALVRGDHKKALMGDKVYEDLEAQHDYNLKAARREGHSPEDVAAAEAELERQIAAEELAGRSAKPGEYDLEAGWSGAEEGALRAGAPKPNKLNARLDELTAEYPDLDREKAATVLRALPDAENGQIAAMSADPEMFDQVARGNLAASEKAQLLKKATDAGAQGALPGMGGGETLFKVGEEAAFTKALTTEQIQDRLGKYGTVEEMPTDRYNRGWLLRLKNDQLAMVFESKDGSLKIGPNEVLGADYAALGITDAEGKTVAGSFKPVSFGSVIELAKGQGLRTFDHETWHTIEHWLLNDKERAAIIKQFGENEETRAEAYANWNPKETPNTVFQKILDFFQRITKAITGKVTGEDVFAAARKGELFGREPMEYLPEALAPSKYRDVGDKEYSPERYVRVTAKDDVSGKTRTVLLKNVVDKGKFLTGIEINKFGEEIAPKGVDERMHLIDKSSILNLTEHRMNLKYGEIEKPTKYRVAEAEGGEWGMEGGLAGRVTGNARAAREEGKAAKNWLMNLFASNRTSKEALKTHQIIAGSQAESATEKMRMQNVFMKYVDDMGPIKGEATQEFLKLYESGQEDQINHPVFKAFGEEFRAEERRHMEIMTMLGDAPKEIPFYIDHLWKENETREQIKAQLNAQVSGGRSMRGPDYYKLLRTVVDIPSGIAQGLEPRFDTLPEMVLAGRSARENRIAATKRLAFIKENGYEKVVRDLEGGTFTVEGPDGKEQTFKSINEARRFATDNPGSSDPRFEPDVPQGWEVYPGGYGEVWAKVKRRGGLMVPERADEETLPLGGGPERMGYEEVPGVDAWSRVGYRVGPKDVTRQFKDFLGRGWSGNTAFELYQSGLHAVRHSQMALSFFHAFFESINSVATHAGGGIFDSLGGLFTGDWRRAGAGLKTLVTSPFAPITDIRLGFDINKTLMKNGIGMPGEATDNTLLKDARTLVGGGMRPEAESKLIKILSNHFKEAFKLKGDLALGKRGNELLQGLSSPTMEVIVPFSKQGSTMFNYLAEVKRWERDNPGVAPTEADLRNIAYECRQTADYIYGRMAKDNVAMNATVKSLLTGVLQFPTWQFGTVGAGVRSMIGAKDVVGKIFDMMQGKEIRQLAMKDRQALQYVTGLLFTVGMVGGLMSYAFTGKPPETMADYFFPKTGEITPNGSEERLQLPSYFKDAMGFTHHPFKTIGAKLASPIHILSDLIENKDYWGTQIYDPNEWIGQRGIDVLKYMAKTTAPFALQSYEQGAKGGPGRFTMSLFGVRPVSREVANTPAQNIIDEYNQIMRASTTTKESAEKKKLKSDLMKMARDQDETGFKEATDAAVSEGKITRQQVKEIVAESQAPPAMGRFIRLPLEWAVRAWGEASDYEKEQWQPYFLKKVMAEKPENLIKNRDAVVDALNDMGLTEAADAITNLTMPEETGVDLTGLGLLKPAPEMSGMEAVDAAIAAGLEAKLEGKVKRVSAMVRPPSLREKKKPYGVLGL